MKKSTVVICALVLVLVIGASCACFLFKSPGCGPAAGFVTGPRAITSSEIEREYYLKLPADYSPDTAYPLIFAFHGFTGDYSLFTEGYYDLQEAVGDGAILVYPNALDINGQTQWDLEADLLFFDDLYAELAAHLCFDTRKVFATGHSNGAVFTNTLGCRRGNVLRAIAPVSGIFLENYTEKACIGRVASMTMHGDNDTTIPRSSALAGRDYWLAVNDCSSEEAAEGSGAGCTAYAGCSPGYPVQYCEYSGGHDWPEGGGNSIWTFFSELQPVLPTRFPGTGKPPASPGNVANIKIHFPDDFVGVPETISLGLYPSGTTQPLTGSPDKILTLKGVPVGDYIPGEVKEYRNIVIDLYGVPQGDYAVIVLVYVAGGSYPVPSFGEDYIGIQEFTLDSSTMTIAEPFELELLFY